MGRSPKKGVDYFPHDTDASERRTIFALEAKYGNDGYAFWFKLLEMLGRQNTAYIDCSIEDEWFFLLHRVRIPERQVEEMLELLANRGAIDRQLWQQRRIIWSDNFVERLEVLYKKRKEGAPQKPSLLHQSEPEKPISDAEKPISASEITESDAEIKPSCDNMFGLTDEEIAKTLQDEAAIESAARRNGLPWFEDQMYTAKDLAFKYGVDNLIWAIKKAGNGKAQTWSYVAGILRNEAARNGAQKPQHQAQSQDENPFAEYKEDT